MKIFFTILLLVITNFVFCQNDDVTQLVKEGVELHDKGEYDKAIAKYKEALKIDPNSALVLYEMSSTCFTKKDYKAAIEYSDKIIRLGNEHLENAYVLNASAFDLSGKPAEAIKVYQQAIEKFPGSYLLKFNLALTAFNDGQYNLSSTQLKDAVTLNPYHASSHNLLGQLNYRTNSAKSIMCFTHYLLIKPKAANSKSFFDLLVSQLEGTSNIQTGELMKVGTSYKEAGDEKIYSAIELSIGLMQAVTFSQERKEKNDFELFAENLEKLFKLMNELKTNDTLSGFWWDYYVTFYAKLTEAGHAKALAYYISQSAHNEKAAQWMTEHKPEADKMMEWVKQYYSK